MKKTKLLLILAALALPQALFAETCPDMSQSSVTPPGWYMIRQGTPLSVGNVFNGAVWNVLFSLEVDCLYNNSYPLTNAFQLVSLQNVSQPNQGAWKIQKARKPINNSATCNSNEITNCPFTYSN